MRRFLIFAASLAVLPTIASAQGRGMGRGTISGMARPAMAGPPVAMRGPSTVGIHTTAGTRTVTGMRLVRTRSGAVVLRPAPLNGRVRNSGSSGAILSQDVPGLGFDFPHFAATHPGRDHDRFRDRQFGGAFIPFFGGGGFVMPLFPEDVEEAPAAEAQHVDTEETPAARAPRREQVVEPPQSYAAAPQPVPQQESDQYVFVRRDGTLFFAVAYAWENGTLRYITGEGIRRTVTADKLDLDATQQFNEQRGLNFRLPA